MEAVMALVSTVASAFHLVVLTELEGKALRLAAIVALRVVGIALRLMVVGAPRAVGLTMRPDVIIARRPAKCVEVIRHLGLGSEHEFNAESQVAYGGGSWRKSQ